MSKTLPEPLMDVFRLWHRLALRWDNADEKERSAIEAEARCAVDAARNERHQTLISSAEGSPQ